MSITPKAQDRGHPSAVRAHPAIAAWAVAYIGAFGVYCGAVAVWAYRRSAGAHEGAGDQRA